MGLSFESHFNEAIGVSRLAVGRFSSFTSFAVRICALSANIPVERLDARSAGKDEQFGETAALVARAHRRFVVVPHIARRQRRLHSAIRIRTRMEPIATTGVV